MLRSLGSTALPGVPTNEKNPNEPTLADANMSIFSNYEHPLL
jgi:hypothetical protein